MKMIWVAAFAAVTLATAGGAQAAERTAHHRHATRGDHAVVARHHAVSRRHETRRRLDSRRERVVVRDDRYDWTEPFRIKPNDDEPSPTINNNYWFQESIYDVRAGKKGNIKEYRY